MINNNKLTTDTDLYFDLLADPTKLKPIENNLEFKEDLQNLSSDDINLIDQANLNNNSELDFQDMNDASIKMSEKRRTENIKFNNYNDSPAISIKSNKSDSEKSTKSIKTEKSKN